MQTRADQSSRARAPERTREGTAVTITMAIATRVTLARIVNADASPESCTLDLPEIVAKALITARFANLRPHRGPSSNKHRSLRADADLAIACAKVVVVSQLEVFAVKGTDIAMLVICVPRPDVCPLVQNEP